MFYSASRNGFFHPDLHGEDGMPDDAVEITAEEHADLLAGQGIGKRIGHDADGRPMLCDPPPMSVAECWAALRAERDRRINAVAWRQERHNREIRMGLPPTDDQATLDAYIQALADLPEATLDLLNPPWPEELP